MKKTIKMIIRPSNVGTLRFFGNHQSTFQLASFCSFSFNERSVKRGWIFKQRNLRNGRQ